MNLSFDSSALRSAILLLSIYFLLPPTLSAQTAIGEWRTHVPYRNAYFLAQNDEKIYCVTNTFFFSYGKDDNASRRYNKVNGLSDTGVDFVKYNAKLDKFLVVYENANVDILHKGKITNVSDILRANILGEKRINGIRLKDEFAYLSTGFGIVVLDMESYEIRDTYFIGDDGDQVRVYNVEFWNDTIWAATEFGLRKAPLDAPILANFQFWEWEPHVSGLPPGSIHDIILFNDALIILSDSVILQRHESGWQSIFQQPYWKTMRLDVSQGKLMLPQQKMMDGDVTDARIKIISPEMKISFVTEGLSRPLHAIQSPDGKLWVADQFRGLLRFDSNGSPNQIRPNSPSSSRVFRMASAGGRVYVAPGGVDIAWANTFNRDGYMEYTGNWWNNFNEQNISGMDTIPSIVHLSINPQDKEEIYLSAFHTGLVRLKNGQPEVFNQFNSILGNAEGVPQATVVVGQAWDDQNNLWMSNMHASHPVVVKSASGEWYRFQPPLNVRTLTDVIADRRGNKWYVVSRNNTYGLLVFNEGQSLENGTPQYRLLSTSPGSGNLPSADVLSIAEDKNGRIWVGTAEGIAVFFCAGQIFSEQGCDAQQIVVVIDGFAGYLFETERVNAIAVDGANRKWVGTNNGVFLISADGTEQIHHFTTQNSPLLSNIITSITIEGKSGEVFIGTEKGLVSYKSDATKGGLTHSEVLVYPNPVRPEYSGPIAIKGLVDEADVRITDITGMVVYQTRALGGQAIWDGKNLNGQRARAGVYLVFSVDNDGDERNVAKIFLVN